MGTRGYEYTPVDMGELRAHEVYVFESNRLGKHYHGDQKVAFDRYGARWGAGEGHFGQTYAIPTLDEHLNKVSEKELKESLVRFIEYVDVHRSLKFYMRRIGIRLFGVETMKRLLWEAAREVSPDPEWRSIPSNLVIPKEFE